MKKKITLILALLIFAGLAATMVRYRTKRRLSVSAFAKAGRPLNIAHRGGMKLWPENTLYAFANAARSGVDVLELDVRPTADSQIVIIHDAAVARTSNGAGLVAQMSLAQLRELNFRGDPADSCVLPPNVAPEIPTLEEVFVLFPDMYFNIEIKPDSPAFAKRVVDLIRRHARQERVVLASFHQNVNRYLQASATDIARAADRDEIRTLVILSKIGLGWLHQPGSAAYEVPVRRESAEIVTLAFIRAAHGAGQEVYVWTIDDSTEMNRLLRLGVDGIITNRPDILFEIKKQFE